MEKNKAPEVTGGGAIAMLSKPVQPAPDADSGTDLYFSVFLDAPVVWLSERSEKHDPKWDEFERPEALSGEHKRVLPEHIWRRFYSVALLLPRDYVRAFPLAPDEDDYPKDWGAKSPTCQLALEMTQETADAIIGFVMSDEWLVAGEYGNADDSVPITESYKKYATFYDHHDTKGAKQETA